jgi:PIN domain nuclease of toxin-antitoxin system
LPEHHRDPFDRILIAQTIAEGLTMITSDAAIHQYPVTVVW